MTINEKLKAALDFNPSFIVGVYKLRELALAAGLKETYKWKMPVYMHNGKNLVSIGTFKNHFGMWFFNGTLLSDPDQILENAQEGKTKYMRHVKFTSNDQVDSDQISLYLKEAINISHADKPKVSASAPSSRPIIIPVELSEKIQNDPDFKASWDNLAQGKKREFADYILEAKRQTTKDRRMDKIRPLISKGIGLNDKYRK